MGKTLLYSFRRCPFAMRARLAIQYANLEVELREVLLKNKPEQLLKASPKATVPVLVLETGQVIDESLDIMIWALRRNDPERWLDDLERQMRLISQCDTAFKACLDKYKYADRHPEFNQEYYRDQCLSFVAVLERKLAKNQYLEGAGRSLADAAIFPFIRQFAHVDKDWFFNADFVAVQAWLTDQLENKLFKEVMSKYPPWQVGDIPLRFAAG